MTHFAIPRGGFSPAEAELVTILDSGPARLDGCVPLGLLLVATDQCTNVILVATAVEFDADGWWTR